METKRNYEIDNDKIIIRTDMRRFFIAFAAETSPVIVLIIVPVLVLLHVIPMPEDGKVFFVSVCFVLAALFYFIAFAVFLVGWKRSKEILVVDLNGIHIEGRKKNNDVPKGEITALSLKYGVGFRIPYYRAVLEVDYHTDDVLYACDLAISKKDIPLVEFAIKKMLGIS